MAISDRESRAASFLSRYRLAVEKIDEREVPIPDFRVTCPDDFCFYSEVKAIEGPGAENDLVWKPLYNRLSADIRKAVEQFNSVNSARLAPNVLVVLSEEMRIHGQSMKDFFQGKLAINGETIADL